MTESNDTDDVDINGIVETHYGYPDANSMDEDMLRRWVGYSNTEFTFVLGTGSANIIHPAAGTFGLSPKGTIPNYNDPATPSSDGTGCFVLYTKAANKGASPSVKVETGGC